MDVNAQCPFFVSEFKKSVTCEGIEEGMETVLRFREVRIKNKFVARYCNNANYEECPYARAAAEKYELSGVK